LTEFSDLPGALQQSAKLQERRKQFPPVNSGHHRANGGLQELLDEEMQWME